MDFVKTALLPKLEVAAQEITDNLMPKYVAEFESLLSKTANRLVKGLAKDLVIEDMGDSLSITLAVNDAAIESNKNV